MLFFARTVEAAEGRLSIVFHALPLQRKRPYATNKCQKTGSLKMSPPYGTLSRRVPLTHIQLTHTHTFSMQNLRCLTCI